VPATPPAPAQAAPAPSTPAPAAESAPPATEPQKLQVQVVLYSDDPAERMVIINGRRYAEGQKVDADTVVERITPDGAVISRRGQRFPLTSGRP
jgi:general secretion pathway protein B